MEPPLHGYAITQTGLLTSACGKPFSLAEVESLMKALWFVLKVMRGSYTSPVCWVGELGGTPRWTRHVAWHLDPWIQGESGPFPTGFGPLDSDAVVTALERALR